MHYLKLAVTGMVALLAIAFLLILLACQPQVAQASAAVNTAECQLLADGVEYRLAHSIPLAEAIPEMASQYGAEAAGEPRTFQTVEQTVTLAAGERVMLSGTSDGAGFVADDLIRLDLQPSGETQSWDFRSPDFTRIVPISTPQEVTQLFATGANTLTLTTQDILGPVYSSSALWLLILEPCAAAQTDASPSDTKTVADVLPTLEPTPQTASAVVVEAASNDDMASPKLLQSTPETTVPVVVEQDAPVVQRRAPMLRGFFFGLTLALFVLGIALWQGRRSVMGLYLEFRANLPAMKSKAKQLLDEVRDWLETLQK